MSAATIELQTQTVPCPKCRGSGVIEEYDPEYPCQAIIHIGTEDIRCFANRQHPDYPHMAILCDPKGRTMGGAE